jgi:hypothetical protein
MRQPDCQQNVFVVRHSRASFEINEDSMAATAKNAKARSIGLLALFKYQLSHIDHTDTFTRNFVGGM